MGALPLNLTLQQTQTQWASQLNPIIANQVLNGRAVTGLIFVANTAVTFNHGLGRSPLGWFVTDIDAAANGFRTQPFNSLTLTLEFTANANVNLWVF